ncbi:hypothetical protein [Bacillus halotolerans]|uniref:hypothetical protein n=1 Tax=Bacillus halotolerans TaxID=260554 RepID=UPI002DBA31F0|nr:hypothetical protein [Bacillus halotolerans]MEC1648735.1 hypothetical protein [Bacillus halotolerans]
MKLLEVKKEMKKLESCFDLFNIVQLSKVPNIPDVDERVDHIILGYDLIETATGLLLLIDLKNSDNNARYTYSYPDIQSIELNNSSGPKFQKWYLNCLDRTEDKENSFAKRLTYRLMFIKR